MGWSLKWENRYPRLLNSSNSSSWYSYCEYPSLSFSCFHLNLPNWLIIIWVIISVRKICLNMLTLSELSITSFYLAETWTILLRGIGLSNLWLVLRVFCFQQTLKNVDSYKHFRRIKSNSSLLWSPLRKEAFFVRLFKEMIVYAALTPSFVWRRARDIYLWCGSITTQI